MIRIKCSACGASDLEQFLNLGKSPIADAYETDIDAALNSRRYPLQVAVCTKCWLVQLLEVVDPEVLFGSGYHFYSSASPPLSAYHATYAQDIRRSHAGLLQHGVLEIGCNDGDMLRHFGDRHLGVDPAVGPTDVARGRGLHVITASFDSSLTDPLGQWGIVIANHVLAHVADVSDFLAGVATVLRRDGLAFIEVQYLPDLLVNNTFDLVYHEHRNFFSLTTLESALARHGLQVVDAELTDRQGGSLRVTACHAAANVPYGGSAQPGRLRHSEVWLSSFGAYEGMQGRAERIRDRLRQLLDAQTGVVALYGAPAKATTLLAFCDLDRDQLAYCWDSTQAKQGRYIPGTRIRIRTPNEGSRPDAFLLAAWNYLRPITRANPGFDWIVPFPTPMEL